MKRRRVHENYHSAGKIQRKIINDRNFTYRHLIKLLKKYSKNKIRILDIGCGVGTIDFYLAKKGKHVTGIDISQKAIDLAKKNSEVLSLSSKIRYEQIDFPKDDICGSFDLVLLTEVLEHLPVDTKALSKILKLLDRDRGVLIVSVPSKNAPLFKLGLLKEFDKHVGHLRRYSEAELFKKLTNTGYKVINVYKTEGILRNLLFTFRPGSFLIRLLRGPFSDIFTKIDNILIPIFGESQIFMIARRK